MKISLNWIKEYISVPETESIDALQDKMVSTGLDIEGVENESDKLKNFVVGEVLEKIKHPDADKLSLCKVNAGGEENLSIVCGAPNVDAGQKVCVALIGAIIPNGDFEIKKSKIRGQLSEGMICSEKELNMSDNHDGIMVLDPKAKIGEKFADYIKVNDIVFDIGITANRGDLFSHFGVAREIGALYNEKIKIPEIKITESEKPTTDLIKISIEANDVCKRFTGRVISNVTIKESPEWLKKRLKAIGLNPKNNIVDITNYVMFETGQPLHAFDYDKINGKEIIVKKAKDGDKFTTLDGKERTLNSESLMICDANGYSGIAGVMGGKNSEISGDTKNIFLESAYFDAVSVRKNSKKLGLMTDASQRFERGVDINMVKYASERAAQLFMELAGGEVSKGLYDVYPEQFETVKIPLRVSKTNDVLGTDLKEEEIISLLEKIEFKHTGKESDSLMFEVPEFRRLDVSREIDLIEETARIFGYDNIEGEMNFNINVSKAANYGSKIYKLNRQITEYLTGRGFNQILTNPLAEEKLLRKFEEDKESIIPLKNSISVEMDSMRTGLIYGMLKIIGFNFNNSGKDSSLKFFESGRIFRNSDKKFKEEDRLIIAMSGKKDSESIYDGEKNFDFFDIKGEAEMFLYKLHLENFTLFYYNDNVSDGIKADIRINDEIIGGIYKVNNKLKSEFEISQDVFAAEFYLNKIVSKIDKVKKFSDIPKFPSVKRDLALIAESGVKYDEIRNYIIKSSGKFLKKLSLFDIYEDEKIGHNKKSIAFTLEFSSNEKTLTDEETGNIIKKILNNLEKNLGVTLRA